MRVKEAPASALRAVFGGIGSLLGVTDKVRAKPTAPETTVSTETAPPETTTPEAAAPEAAAPEAAAPEATAPEAAVVEVEVVEVDFVEVDVIEVAAPEVVAPEVVAPEPVAVVTEPLVVEPVVAGDAVALPLANYDDLSIASLRARLRNLSADQLGTLIEYEKSHAARADVITMFERRIVKLAEA